MLVYNFAYFRIYNNVVLEICEHNIRTLIFQVDPPDGEGPRNPFCSSPRNHGYHVQTLVSGGHDVVDV